MMSMSDQVLTLILSPWELSETLGPGVLQDSGQTGCDIHAGPILWQKETVKWNNWMLAPEASSWSQRNRRWHPCHAGEERPHHHCHHHCHQVGREGQELQLPALPPGQTLATQDKVFITINGYEPMKLHPLKKTDSPSSKLQSLWTYLYQVL